MLALVKTTKRCSKCGEDKPATPDFFNRNGVRLHPWCKICTKNPEAKRSRSTRIDNRELEERIADTNKVCTRCRETKSKSEFYTCSRSLDGLKGYCRACSIQLSSAVGKRLRRQDWTFRLLGYIRTAYGNKRKAKTYHWIPTDLHRSALWDLYSCQEGKCFWTGVPLSLEDLGKPWSVSLDRLDCSKGYTTDNVVLVCLGANFARNDSTPDEMRVFIEMIRRS